MLTTAACVIALSVTGVSAASAATPPAQVSYKHSVPSWAKHSNDHGKPAKDTSVEGEVFLPLRDEAAAAALATAVSTPGSRQYRHTRSPKDWIDRFSPTRSDFRAVLNYLRHSGLTIVGTPDSRQYVVFRGSQDQVNAAFATSLHTYSVAGRQLIAPATAPSLPAAVGSKVSGVSLDQSRLTTRPDSIEQGNLGAAATPQAKSRSVAAPLAKCSSYYGENTATVPKTESGQTQVNTFICGYDPSQIRAAYGVDSLVKHGADGSGQTVAIIDAYGSPSIVNDVNTYSARLGEPTLTRHQYRQIVPKAKDFADQAACQYPSGWQGEQTLDVEAVHGVAPGANILYVGGYNCGGGLDLAMSTILDHGLASIVSNSYGYLGELAPADVIQGEENLHLQAAGEGIGLYFSSGDSGDETPNLGYTSPDYPASSPYVTAVGGTSLGIDKHGRIALETGWGDILDQIVANPGTGKLEYAEPLPGNLWGGGAGGGVSAVFDQPAYQKGVVPAGLANGRRVSPDVAALADPYTGYKIGIRPITDDTTLKTGGFVNETYGGTSLASPLTAAQVAIVQQLAHRTIGFANPALYDLSRVPGAFRDVLPSTQALAYTSAGSGNNYLVSLDEDLSLTTTEGYDDVTGLGGVSFSLLSRLGR